MSATVIFHKADWDGLFCEQIARKFLPSDTIFIGWEFGDNPLPIPQGAIYVLDLPFDLVFGLDYSKEPANVLADEILNNILWFDHHRSSIKSLPTTVRGYRLDGVAACRLIWQWFSPTDDLPGLPTKENFINREVSEPVAVCLAGEYDVWDHRGDGDIEFQFGLDARSSKENMLGLNWHLLLSNIDRSGAYVAETISAGTFAMRCYAKRDADIMRDRSFILEFEGLKFLALTTARCNSNTFAAKDVPETGHDALMAFYYNGRTWVVSLYHAKHRTDIDLSQIAVKYGGGGHPGAAGYQVEKLPFIR